MGHLWSKEVINPGYAVMGPPCGGVAFQSLELLLAVAILFIKGLPLSLIYWLTQTRYTKKAA
jgi:hypothetical protein